MTRVLITYSNVAERKLAARRACRLSARGVDVDLATTAAAAHLPAAAYDRVIDATSHAALPEGARDHEGIVYIATAGLDRLPRAIAPSVYARARRGDALVAVAAGAIAALGLTTLSLPPFYPLVAGILVALALVAVLTELRPTPVCADTPSGSTPLVSCG